MNYSDDQNELLNSDDMEENDGVPTQSGGWRDRLYQHRWQIGVGLVGVLLFVLIIVAIVAASGDNNSSDDDDQPPVAGKRGAFRVGPFTIGSGQRQEFFAAVDRRSFGLGGALLLKAIRFRICTEEGHTVPLQHIYNHHSFCADESLRVFGAVGAEGASPRWTPFSADDASDGFYLADEATFLCAVDWIDLYGRIATMNQTAYAEFELVYADVPDPAAAAALQADQMQFDIWGNNIDEDAEFPVPPGPLGDATCVSSETVYRRDRIEVHSVRGHLHIGAINETLVEKSTGRLLVVSRPVYDQFDFIVDLQTNLLVPKLQLVPGATYITTACYKNRASGYSGVMALWAGYYKNLDRPGVSIYSDDDDN